jgi:glucuronate isomerase
MLMDLRVLCNLTVKDLENGEIRDSNRLVGPMILNLCYQNAKEYFCFDA